MQAARDSQLIKEITLNMLEEKSGSLHLNEPREAV